MIRIFSVQAIVIALLAIGCSPESRLQESEVVFPIRKDGQWGIVNSAGSERSPVRFTEVASACNVMGGESRELGQESALLITETEWVFFQKGSKQSFPSKVKYGKSIRYVNLGDSLFTIWDDSKPPENQTIAVTFDPTGRWRASVGVLAYGQFADGLVPILDGGKYGYADRLGQIKIGAQFKSARAFSEGVAAVKDEEGWTYIDATGAVAIPLHFDSFATRFDRGVALVADKGEKFAIDRKGHRLATLKSNWGGGIGAAFSEGLIRMRGEEGRWGFVDANGLWKIEPKFALVTDFSEGLAGANLGVAPRRTGYIDWTGEFVVLVPNAKTLGEFHHGQAWVETKDGTVGYVDKKGEWRWKYVKP